MSLPPRAKLLDPVAIGIDHGRCDALLRLVVAEDDGGHTGLGLLADQLGDLVIVKVAQGPDHWRPPGHAARLRALADDGRPTDADFVFLSRVRVTP